MTAAKDGEDGAFLGRLPQGSSWPFQSGGRVERTGIALVHAGECIVPEEGCEALIASDGGGGVAVNYYFPVEIEVIGSLSEEQLRQVSDYVFDELSRELSSRV